MKSRQIAIILALCLIAPPACRRESAAPVEPSASEAPFKAGLLTPGSIDDGGWNSIAWEGLQQIRKTMGAEVSHQETKTPAEFEEGFRYFGANRFNLAFGHGFEFQDAALAAGRLYPETIYITTSGSSVSSNVSPMVFELEQATYLLGILSALESKSGRAALVGGIRLPSIDSTFLAFREGAKSVAPRFVVQQIYTGNFDDAAAARVAALTLIDQGADFIFHQANEAGRGVFAACQEKRIRCFGSNRNQNDLAPEVILASAVLEVPAAFVHMAGLVRSGKFEPKIYRLGMNEGIVSLEWNDRLKSSVSPETIARLEQTEARIRDGSLEVPRGF